MRRRSTMRNRSGSAILVWAVVVMAIVSGYTASKYVAVPMMVSYRAAIAEKQSQQGNDDKTEELVKQPEKQSDGSSKADQTEEPSKEKSGVDIVDGQQDIPEESTKETTAPVKEPVKETTAPVKEAAPQGETLNGLYCIQFGSFATRTAAETTIAELAGKNISAFIKEKDGVFKIYSIPYDSKEKAKAAANAMAGQVADLFVVAI